MCDVSESASGCVDGRSRRDDGDIVTHLVYEKRHQSSSDDGVADHDVPVGCECKDATGIWSAYDDDDDDGDSDMMVTAMIISRDRIRQSKDSPHRRSAQFSELRSRPAYKSVRTAVEFLGPKWSASSGAWV